MEQDTIGVFEKMVTITSMVISIIAIVILSCVILVGMFMFELFDMMMLDDN